MADHGEELASSIEDAEQTIRELRAKPRLSKADYRRLEMAYALRDHRRKISRRELRAKLRAGWR